MSAGDWSTIESDPGVFTELIRGFGVDNVQVEELYTLDFDQLYDFKPIYGLIFLFKYRPGEETTGKLDPNNKDVYFSQQVINNACATQAIVNLLLNLNQEQVTLGNVLENFQSFSKELDPQSRGLCLSNSQEIRSVHNSFARPNFLEIDQSGKGAKEDAYHFVTYVPVNGHVYELDGLKEAPVNLGAISEGKDWLDIVHDVLETRIKRHTTNEITFNLMALVADRKKQLEKQLKLLTETDMESDDTEAEICRIQNMIDIENNKFQHYRTENTRRRHNYLPFIVELLKTLAKEGKLNPLVEQAVADEEISRKKFQSDD
ncbi:Ubiquitin carboxyl-terminal hydrolase [Aphelenchoides bicaudatus]|nr:Ubiquitin carboxyl-terminal hydrolase [Aphelenchoides bicaudatus]